jgi:hypothetical protein
LLKNDVREAVDDEEVMEDDDKEEEDEDEDADEDMGVEEDEEDEVEVEEESDVLVGRIRGDEGGEELRSLSDVSLSIRFELARYAQRHDECNKHTRKTYTRAREESSGLSQKQTKSMNNR